MIPQHYCPHKIAMTACGDCNYIHSDCQYQILKWDGEMIQKMLCGAPSSRPALSPRIDVSKCFEDIVYSSAPWKIYRQDAGMGEHDYAVFLNDVFFCRAEHSQTASEIIRAIRFAANTRNSEAHDAAIAAQARSDIIKTFAEVERLHDVDGITYPDLYNEFIERLKKLRSTGGEPR